jgi:SPP1 family phage portal protein
MNIFRASEFNLKEVYDFIYVHRVSYQPHYQRLKDYYDGAHDILQRTQTDTSKPNNKLVNNFCDYIVNQAAAYFMGTPVSYTSDNEALLLKVQDIMMYNDEADINSQHAENIGIYGSSFELHYIDKEDSLIDTRFAVVSPQEMFIVYSYDLIPAPLYAVRYYQVENNSIDNSNNFSKYKVEIYTPNQVLYYVLDGSLWQLENEVEHFYNDVPVVEVMNNTDRVGDFEKVLTLIDQYNLLESDSANDFEYFSDAYLFIKGAGLDETSAAQMRTNKIINVVEPDADASFLTKDIQDVALENFKNRIVNDIHKFSGIPNLTDENFAGNLSGVAIKYKLLGLENIAGKKERRFKKALQRRLELLTRLLFVRGIIPQSNYFDIEIAFKRTLPANELEQAQMIQTLYGTVSRETLLSLLDFIPDAAEEMARIQAEKADNSFEAAFTDTSVVTGNGTV